MTDRERPVAVLFVCMGNICRSPAAQGVMEHLIRSRGLEGRVVADSAGTIGYHAGNRPDARMRIAAARRGFALDHQARRVRAEDFQRFDYILAMDGENLEGLRELAAGQPDACARVSLLLEHLPGATPREVPDPYYGGPDGFELVLDLAEKGCAALLDEIVVRHGLR